MKKALKTEGFAFIEALSTCPPQYGRRNRLGSPTAMLNYLLDNSVSREKAARMDAAELEGKLITGEFSDGRD